jgi:tRNA (mo5U34)-methyltransferase
MTRKELLEKAEKISWYHAIDLGGYVTKGRFDPAQCLERYGLPSSLSGQNVLDIGAWDGWFSFECERRGAHRVIASDSYAWGFGGPIDRDGQSGFKLAHEALGSQVVVPLIWDPALEPCCIHETFDVVLFLGVLYHLIDPLAALARVGRLLKRDGLLIVETHIDATLDQYGFPAARFYPGADLCNDSTNWWGPNTAAVLAWLARVGLEGHVYHKTEPHPALHESTRLVVHARKAKNGPDLPPAPR